MPDTPQVDLNEFDKKYAPAMDVNEFDAKYGGSEDKYSGSFADKFFDHTVLGRIATAFGHGLKGHPESVSNLEGELKNWSSKTGLYSTAAEKDKTFAKSFNEVFIRPKLDKFAGMAHFADSLIETGKSIFGAVQGATFQAGKEARDYSRGFMEDETPSWGVEKQLLAPALGMAGEALLATAGSSWDVYHDPYTGEVKQGTFSSALPDLPFSEFSEIAARARAKGLIGEGESGYFNTRPVTKDIMERRIEAANDAGVPPEIPPTPLTDANQLARLVDPDTYKEWDRLQKMLSDLRNVIKKRQDALTDDLALGRIQTPAELAKRDADIDYLLDRLTSADERLRDLIPKTADARQRALDYLESDTPEGKMFRDYVNDASQKILLEDAIKMMELEPEVALARQHAENLLPDPNTKPAGVLNENPNVSSKSSSVGTATANRVIEEEPR